MKYEKGHTPANKGKIGIYHPSQEARIRMSLVHQGKKRAPFSVVTRLKMSQAKKGRKLSEEHKVKIGISGKGKRRSEETKRRISEAKTGSKHPQWLGGKSFEPYTTDWTRTLRRAIRERDFYTCQICKEPQGDRALSVHHIDYDKKNCNPDNLISLCHFCHSKTNTKRNYWIKYFNE